MMKYAVLSFAALAFSGLASASLIPKLDAVPTVGPNYTWSYTLTVSSDEQLNPGATMGQKCAGTPGCPSGTYFTIYDIAQYVSGSATQTAAGWTNTTQFVGITPSTQLVTDAGNLINVTWFYTGAPAPDPQTPGVDLMVKGFSYQSTSNIPVTSVSSYNATKFGNPGIDQGNNPIAVPGASAVPEPGSMMLLGGGLIGLGLIRRKLVS